MSTKIKNSTVGKYFFFFFVISRYGTSRTLSFPPSRMYFGTTLDTGLACWIQSQSLSVTLDPLATNRSSEAGGGDGFTWDISGHHWSGRELTVIIPSRTNASHTRITIRNTFLRPLCVYLISFQNNLCSRFYFFIFFQTLCTSHIDHSYKHRRV